MLTKHDQEVLAEQGLITPERLRALQHALVSRGRDAKEASREDGQDERAAAALRGKAAAYFEASLLVDQVRRGQPMHLRGWAKRKRHAFLAARFPHRFADREV